MSLAGILASLLVVGTAAWVGELATVLAIVLSARGTVDDRGRVALFRSFGRVFTLLFGLTALVVFGAGIALGFAAPGPLVVSVIVLGGCLIVATVVGILQARRMTRLRGALAESRAASDGATTPVDGAEVLDVRRHALIAAVLRAVLVLGYLAMLVLAVLVGSGL
jgi:hypothetical protein